MNPTAAVAVDDMADQDTPPTILFLGRVEIVGASDTLVESTRRKRLTELAAILSTNPGCDHTTIDACYYPGQRVSDNTRNTQMSKLRRWLGTTAAGGDYLPRYESGQGYHLHPRIRTDWDAWCELLPAGPEAAIDETLEQALKLVRGRPFEGVRARRYGWAERLKQEMITAIVAAAYELGRRRVQTGDWRGAEEAVIVGLAIEPGLEKLWRLRILAAHASGNARGVQEAIARLHAIAADLGSDLEPATERLLGDLQMRASTPRNS